VPFEFHLYNQSNDGLTAAIRAHVDVIRALAAACTGQDASGTGRTLTDYIAEADAAQVDKPDPFIRHVDVLWQHPGLNVQPVYSQGRVLRVTYSGNIKPGGGVAFQAYCMVHPQWWPLILPLHTTPVQIEYHTGTDRDLIVVL
jgi:hypothetical protein